MTATELRSALTAARGQRDLLLTQKQAASLAIAENNAEASLLQRCSAVCEQLSSSARERVAGVIGPVCTGALQDVFSPSYSLSVVHQQQPSGKYVSRLVAGDGQITGDVLNVRGGSVANILGMFIPAAVSLLRPDLVAPVFSFDEPLSGVGGAPLRAAAEAIYQLTHDCKRPVQVILTTQINDPAVWDDLCDVRVHVSQTAEGQVTAKSVRRSCEAPELNSTDTSLDTCSSSTITQPIDELDQADL